MCDTCGCNHAEHFRILPMQEGAPERHYHPQTLPVSILAKNDRLAERNRGWFAAKEILALNLLSSPGSGKTELLARTLETLAGRLPSAVLVGDLETDHDAQRLRGKGAPVAQILTGDLCHLDAEMVARGLENLETDGLRLLFIENVGNLVCPAAYDLGEAFKIVLLSVTEGEEKPLKYPPLFQNAGVVIITKTDLLAATGFDLARARQNIAAVAPEATVLELSARSGEGMGTWLQFLEGKARP